MADVTLRWVGALDADINTDYVIESDAAESGTFASVITQGATAPYTPVSTTLDGALDDSTTTVILTDGTNFAEGDVIVVDKEPILLGTKSTHTFSGCTRAYGQGAPAAHADLATVYKAHESYTATVTFGNRAVIRFRIHSTDGTDTSDKLEIVAVQPPQPPTSNLCAVWGVLEDLQGNPDSGVVVTCAFLASVAGTVETDAYGVDTGELIEATSQTDTTDADGFFHFFLRRDSSRNSGIYRVTWPSGSGTASWDVTAVPDQSHINIAKT